MLKFIAFSAGCIMLSGCVGMTHFGPLMNSQTPDASALASHVQCELYHIVKPDKKHPAIDNYSLLVDNRYIAYALLTMDVTSNEGFTPSLNFIQPYSKAMTNLTGTVAGQLSGVQHRNMTESFTIILDPRNIGQDEVSKYCPDEINALAGLHGELGLNNIIEAGLYHATKDQFLFPLPPSADPAVAAAHLSQTTAPVFGSTIDFSLIYGITSAGPTWTISHFKGPGGGNPGLLNALRTVKDTLVISFAPARPETRQGLGRLRQGVNSQLLKRPPESSPSTPDPQGDALAARAAQDNTSRLILQNILPGLPQQ